MSIAKRVAEAIDRMAQKDAEGALLPISAAIDATATKHFGTSGRKSYKSFLHENLGLITKVGLGPAILNLNLEYDHPDIQRNADGTCPIQDILYHVVRCGLAHDAELPSNLRFTDEYRFTTEDNVLILPASLIYGMIVAVVVCPVNGDQSVAEQYGINVRGFQIRLNKLWGKKQEVMNLFAAMEAF